VLYVAVGLFVKGGHIPKKEIKEAQAEAERKAELIEANKKKEVMLIAANAKLQAATIFRLKFTSTKP